MSEGTAEQVQIKMQRSPVIEQKIADVRQLPQDSLKHKQEKRERARLLRMETMLANAQLAYFITAEIEINPRITIDELKQLAVQSGHVVDPNVVDNFINVLMANKQRVIRGINSLKEEGKANIEYPNLPKTPETILFLYMQELGRRKYPPQGIIMLDKSFPLALVLRIYNPEDFARIDSRTNVGGFFRDQQKLYPADSESFPIIAVMGDGNLTLQHEKQHVRNKSLANSLPVNKRKCVWWINENQIELNKNVATFKSSNNVRDIENAKKYILDYALGKAKDEAIFFKEHSPDIGQDKKALSYFNEKATYNAFVPFFQFIDEAEKQAA